jgi:hypothetical protein
MTFLCISSLVRTINPLWETPAGHHMKAGGLQRRTRSTPTSCIDQAIQYSLMLCYQMLHPLPRDLYVVAISKITLDVRKQPVCVQRSVWSREIPKTRTPLDNSSSATAAPMPLDVPVTSTQLAIQDTFVGISFQSTRRFEQQ